MISAKEREALRLVRVSNRKLNEVRFSESETFLHQMAKRMICQYLKGVGKNFITEAIFEKHGRADIFVLEDLTIIEVLCSEKLSNIENKKKLYPAGLKIIPIVVEK